MEIVRVKFGSYLYGTSTPQSDIDLKSVCIPSAKDILLGKVKKSKRESSKLEREKQVAGIVSRNLPDDIDIEVLSLKHFFTLLGEGQSMALDMLFAINDNLIKNTAIWEEIQHNKHRLVTCKIEESIRYMNTQSKKYGIKGSRVAECRRFRDFFATTIGNNSGLSKVSVFGDYIKAVVESCEHTKIIRIKQIDGSMLDHLECVGKKIPFSITVKEAHKILDLFFQKYGQRTLDAENNQGIDWKALSHAVRVGTQTIELLETGVITFPRPDAPYLRQIKSGEIHFKEVSEKITGLVDEVRTKVLVSSLPDEVDKEWIDIFVYEMYRNAVLMDMQY